MSCGVVEAYANHCLPGIDMGKGYTRGFVVA